MYFTEQNQVHTENFTDERNATMMACKDFRLLMFCKFKNWNLQCVVEEKISAPKFFFKKTNFLQFSLIINWIRIFLAKTEMLLPFRDVHVSNWIYIRRFLWTQPETFFPLTWKPTECLHTTFWVSGNFFQSVIKRGQREGSTHKKVHQSGKKAKCWVSQLLWRYLCT